MNRRVDIREDLKHYQDTLSCVDYSVGENLFMLPSNTELKIKTGTVRYNNKILVSSGTFSLGKTNEVNSSETSAIKNHKTNSLELTHAPAISQKNQEPKTITHSDEKIALVLSLAGGSAIWNMFRSILESSL